jgi:lipopolysaccharide export system protein LptA
MIMRARNSTMSIKLRAIAAAASMLIATAAHAAAQPNATKGNASANNASSNNASPNNNALQGFSQNRNQPVQIEAASLEVRDKEKKATFTGNVKVVQGDTIMRCKTLVVFYDSQGQQPQQAGAPAAAQPMKAAAPGPGGSSSISRLEASGGVTVIQKDQVANGDRADFDMKSNTVILKGNVVVTQGGNIMRGDRLTVDLTSGVSRVDGSGPVKLLIPQTGSADGKPGSGMGGLGGLGGMGSKNGLVPGSQRQNSSN